MRDMGCGMRGAGNEMRDAGYSIRTSARRGVATLDYVLVLGIVLPMATLLMWVGPRMMRLVYELTTVVLGWPFT